MIVCCPECNSAISDTAKFCPHCGHTVKKEKHKNKLLLFLVIFQSLIIVALAVLSLNLYTELLYFSGVATEKSAFPYSSDNKYDPYGFAGKNNIIGEDISIILEQFEVGIDYTISKNDVFCAYTFSEQIDYPVGDRASLTLYTDAGSSKITLIEYSFHLKADGSDLALRYYMAMKDLTDYYDMEPTFSYVTSDYTIAKVTSDEFSTLLRKEFKTLYTVTWEMNDNLAVNLDITFTTDIKDLTCSISYCIRDNQ